MIYDVYLQVKRTGRRHAHVPGLPGCNWLADTPEAAWSGAVGSISEHLAWLGKYSQLIPPEDEPVIPRLAQQHKSTAYEGNLIGFFESERLPDCCCNSIGWFGTTYSSLIGTLMCSSRRFGLLASCQLH